MLKKKGYDKSKNTINEQYNTNVHRHVGTYL